MMRRLWGIGAVGLVVVACAQLGPSPEKPTFRVAAFNVSLYREAEGALRRELAEPGGEQLEAIKAIIATVDPDILVLNEFDYDPSGVALDRFAGYLANGYDHRLALPSNTGVPTGLDLDGDGRADHPLGSREYGNDAFGYGVFPGQYAIAVLSKFPIKADDVRTYRKVLWRDMPDNLLPTEFYSGEVQEIFRLSSKTHAVVPVTAPGGPVHLVLAHPTPPGFDGEEDRNGRRNHDEVRLIEAIITDAPWLRDDDGQPGGLGPDARFVIAGDLNADPVDGARVAGVERPAIQSLLDHPRTIDPEPRSRGGAEAAIREGEGNLTHSGDPALDTGDFRSNLRVDYVLPSADFTVEDAGVYWPSEGEPGFDLVGPGYPPVSSDHRLVWVDLAAR